VWEEAALYYDEKQLAALVLSIGVINLFNRVNASTRQVAGRVGQSAEGPRVDGKLTPRRADEKPARWIDEDARSPRNRFSFPRLASYSALREAIHSILNA